MKLQHTDSRALLAGVTSLGFLFALFLTECVCFAVNIRSGGWVLPVAFVLSAGLCLAAGGLRRCSYVALAVSAAVGLVSAVLCMLLYDTAFDSVGYHYNTVVMIDRGWNPFSQYAWNDSVWSMHYAKALELMQAAVLSFTGNLQTVRCVNLIFTFSAAAIVWHALGLCMPATQPKWRLAVLLVALCNPVLTGQLFSALNDYALWLETLILASSFIIMWQRPLSRLPYLIVFVIVAIALNTRFTHGFYIGLECLVFAVWCLLYGRRDTLLRGSLTVIAALVAGLCLLGYNPYVINTLEYGSIVYPLGGASADIDIMTGNTPAMYVGGNRFGNFFKSLLSVGDTSWALLNGGVTPGSLARAYSSDMRVNGFGIFMVPMLALGLALMVMSRARLRWWALYVYVLAMAFCFEQSWWARYIPFLWLLTMLPPVLALRRPFIRRRAVRAVALALTACALLNGAASLAASLYPRLSYTLFMDYVFSRGRTVEVTPLTYGLRQQFEERGVAYDECFRVDSIPAGAEGYYQIFGLDHGMEHVMRLPQKDFPELYNPENLTVYRLGRAEQRRY